MKMVDDTTENLEEKEKFVRSFLENEGENFYNQLNIFKNMEKKIIDYNERSRHIPTFDIPISSTTFVSHQPSTTTFVSPPIQPEINQPKITGHREIIFPVYFKPQMPTQIPTDTGHLPYIQIEDRRYNPHIPAPIQNIPLQVRPTQLVSTQPLEEEEIRHIINKVAAGTQTQPLGIANMEEIKTLIKNILT